MNGNSRLQRIYPFAWAFLVVLGVPLLVGLGMVVPGYFWVLLFVMMITLWFIAKMLGLRADRIARRARGEEGPATRGQAST